MYLICRDRVLLGLDGFIKDSMMGSQIRIFCFGLNIWWANGDIDPDGNGISIHLGMPYAREVL